MEFEENVEYSEERSGQDNEYKLDSNKLRTLTGWKDTIDLDQGLEQTIDWIDQNYKTLVNMNREYVHKV